MVKKSTIFTQNVDIMCKTICKTTCISYAKLCANHKKFTQYVENITFPPTFPNFFAMFFTTIQPLFIPKLFHFFTKPTITIINKLEERN